ncbi:peroxiredoxin [Mucilaginibacter rubeus]|uniref:TlpA disulfide reductase family protein n=1 Tax=Mucilaginibacter rubeus TaxID=2027860 RepID=UPI003393FB10
MRTRLITGIALIAVMLGVSCNDRCYFTLSGTVVHPGALKKVFLLAADSTQLNVIDSTILNSGQFEFNYAALYAGLYKIRIGNSLFDIVAMNGDQLKFATDLADLTHSYSLTGSKEAEKIREFNRITNIYDDKNSQLADEYAARSATLGRETDSLVKVYRPKFQQNMSDYSAAVLKFVNANKRTFAAFYAATSLDPVKYEKELIGYADAIKNDFTDHPAVQRFVTQMESAKPVSIGHKAPDFSVRSIAGRPVKLSDYRGKYVMLDFWASWCPACRQENPNVVMLYNKFRTKGFTILGVSLDTDKDEWQRAVNADKLSWDHVSDLQRFDGPAERLYHIEALPSNFIIDQQGIIIAKNITGPDLEAFLNRTLNH